MIKYKLCKDIESANKTLELYPEKSFIEVTKESIMWDVIKDSRPNIDDYPYIVISLNA